ncbi:hypothetical protein C8046_13750 [Serinibacter arcticus]|uniref:ANTAR domain-containing protein n=1 Tax=Serinibacter arcticus TaxID=1655435 RepID=A0A2U1ZX75_9MICO|nr:GAF and ANTAR domain-containing protein [Serinibacter arcticus]PWD51550.1 hypothetical protein C8046_13750 [Serinibacter arcticus]
MPEERISLEMRMAALAATLDELGTLEETLTAVTHAALELIPAATAVSITLRRGSGRVESIGMASEIARNVVALQYSLNEGPCLDAAREVPLCQSPDIRVDTRWPVWGPAAHAAEGIVSILSIQLLSARGVHGALNIFGRRPNGFDSDDVAQASVLTVHAGIALRTTLLEEDLRAAITSRHLIGQAQGLLMERYQLDAESAFALLKRLSSTSNTKVVEIARRLVEERGAVVPTA